MHSWSHGRLLITLTRHGFIEHGCSNVEPGVQPIEPNPDPAYPLGQMQTGPVIVSAHVANGWQKFCLAQGPVVTPPADPPPSALPPSEGIVRTQYLPSPCHPAGQDPQRNDP